jgi:hypothetical protein
VECIYKKNHLGLIRVRVEIACHNCRKAKSKCDREKPTCSRCTGLGKECEYTKRACIKGSPSEEPLIPILLPKTALDSTFEVVKELSEDWEEKYHKPSKYWEEKLHKPSKHWEEKLHELSKY